MNTLISKSGSGGKCASESRALGRVCHGGREEMSPRFKLLRQGPLSPREEGSTLR